jgi:hypothetical protein
MLTVGAFFKNRGGLEGVSLRKLIFIAALAAIFVFISGIEKRSSRIVEAILNPDNLINLAVDWRADAPSATAVTVIDYVARLRGSAKIERLDLAAQQ